MTSPLLKPRWIVGHVLVVVVSVLFVLLGFWQLGRHADQRADNEMLEAKLASLPIALTAETAVDPDNELRQATVVGEYRFAVQLELRPRTFNGRVGYNQVVPFATADGAVLVNRGFIADADGRASETPQSPGPLQVTGTIRPSQGTSRFGPQNPDEGILETIARIDTERLNPQYGDELYPVYLDLVSESIDPGGLETVLPVGPEPTSTPHFLYTLQWWSFAVIASVGWVLYLRKQFFST